MLTIKPRQTNTQCYRVTQLRSVSIQQQVLKEESFTWPKSDIGELSHLIDCHGVCGNNNEFSLVTNLLVLHATNAGKFRLNMNFPSPSPKRKQTSCQGEAIVCFHSLFESWQTPCRYKTADDFSWIELGKIPEDSVLCNKKRKTDVTWNIAANPGQDESGMTHYKN